MNKLIDFINGKKTYLGALAMFIIGGLFALKVITKEEFDSYMVMAGAFTAVGFRHAMGK